MASAVDVCKACKDSREKEHKKPRALIRLPLAITQDKVFQKKGIPVRMCKHCDGDAYENAMKAHKDRSET